MVEMRAIGLAVERNALARNRHDQEIAEIRMARARKMRVAEPLDRPVFVAVAGGPFVAFADDAGGVGVGAQLHHAEGRDRAGKGMTFAASADERIHRIVSGAGLGRRRQREEAGEAE